MIGSLLASIPAPSKISFPGFGIDEFVLDPVAFRIPLFWTDGEKHPIMWYGILITLAMIVGFVVAYRKSKFEGIKSDDLFDLAIYLIIAAIVGARLYYVLSEPQKYDSFYDVIAIWNGGLGIYGGVMAGAATILVFSKIKKIKTAKLLDVAAPGLIIGQVIGRWGNFFNAEAYGAVTELPWRMGIAHGYWADEACTQVVYGATQYHHPTFLYELLWNLIGFILIMSFYKKKKYDGAPTLWYLVWYGFGRFFIEGLRTDSLYFLPSVLGQTVRKSQLVAALCVVGGIALMIICGIRAKRAKQDAVEYAPVYLENTEEAVKEADVPATEENESEAKVEDTETNEE